MFKGEIIMRRCKGCGSIKPLKSGYYGQWVYPKTREPYFNYQGKCKKCISKQNMDWQRRNIEKSRQTKKEWARRNTDITRFHANKPERKIYYKEWTKRNPDKVKKYTSYRQMHKMHDITEQEWIHCREYFSYECAYCGIDELDARKMYGNYLHKDHADHKGTNDLSNCIPACKSCNGKKYTFELEEWYKSDENFSEERLTKINSWLNNDYKKYIKRNYETIQL